MKKRNRDSSCGGHRKGALREGMNPAKEATFAKKEEGFAVIKVYGKLIRDRIPEIIAKDGKSCKTRVLSLEEYKTALRNKLNEEMKEYQEAYDIHELADVQEIIDALVVAEGLTEEQFRAIQKAKRDSNGAFNKRLYLESVDDGE